MSKDAYWFRHDSTASRDIKLMKIKHVYDFWGIGVYWSVIEVLREQENYKFECDESSLKMFSSLIQCSDENIFIDWYNDAVKFGLFEEKNGFFYSKSLIERLEKWETKKANGKKGGRPKKEHKTNENKPKLNLNKTEIKPKLNLNKKRNESIREYKSIEDNIREENSIKDILKKHTSRFEKWQMDNSQKKHLFDDILKDFEQKIILEDLDIKDSNKLFARLQILTNNWKDENNENKKDFDFSKIDLEHSKKMQKSLEYIKTKFEYKNENEIISFLSRLNRENKIAEFGKQTRDYFKWLELSKTDKKFRKGFKSWMNEWNDEVWESKIKDLTPKKPKPKYDDRITYM